MLLRIFGADVDRTIAAFWQDAGIKTVVLDSTDSAATHRTFGSGPQFDIVIDDGCHRLKCIGATWKNLQPLLRADGVYVIEDYPAYYTEHVGWDPLEKFQGKGVGEVCMKRDNKLGGGVVWLVIVYPEKSRAPTLANTPDIECRGVRKAAKSDI